MPAGADHPANRDVLGSLLARRILFVAGKGGSGKTTIAAALLLLAARRGKRVLGMEVDAKGDLAAALGSAPVGFDPEVVQTNISVLALHPEGSLREYLKVYFRVPKMVSLTPLSRVFDFIATSVPGPKDMLTIGKIAYEERRETRAGVPRWDLIVVDCAATGHALAQILAAREMQKLTRGGMVQGQLEWVDAILRDHKKTALLITALPEEMPVVEAVELYEKARAAHHIDTAACFLNRTPPLGLHPKQRHLLDAMVAPENVADVNRRLDGSTELVRDGVLLAEQLRATATVQTLRLREAVEIPIVEVPLQVAKPGLTTSRAVAAAITKATS